jgi:hypothetical protein
VGALRLVVALGRLRCLVPEKLLEQFLTHALVGEALGDGVPKQVWIHALVNPGFFGYVLDDLLNAALRVVPSLARLKEPTGFSVAHMEA